MDLADVGDLFERGADKVGQALPRVFAERAKSGMELDGSDQVRVRGEMGLEEG